MREALTSSHKVGRCGPLSSGHLKPEIRLDYDGLLESILLACEAVHVLYSQACSTATWLRVVNCLQAKSAATCRQECGNAVCSVCGGGGEGLPASVERPRSQQLVSATVLPHAGYKHYGFNRGEDKGKQGVWYREWAPGAKVGPAADCW